MEVRYFYRIGGYPGLIEQDQINISRRYTEEMLKAMQADHMRSFNDMAIINSEIKRSIKHRTEKVPEIFKSWGYDIRTRIQSNIFKEISKDDYQNILTNEFEILNREGTIAAGFTSWHCPIAVEGTDYERLIKELCNLDEIKIEEWE